MQDDGSSRPDDDMVRPDRHSIIRLTHWHLHLMLIGTRRQLLEAGGRLEIPVLGFLSRDTWTGASLSDAAGAAPTGQIQMTLISGTIITYNEEHHIEACVASLRRVCAEVVVVDSLSTDRTAALAEAAGARVIPRAYLGEGPQRNLTETRAAHDWILALDADERLDDELVTAIQTLALQDPAEAYAFNRKSFVGPRWIRGPGFYPDYVTRLYNRTQAAYEPKPGHAGVLAPRVRRVSGHILHYTYDGLSDWIAKINWLTSRDAQGLFDAGKSASALRPAASALGACFRQLILRGGLFRGGDSWTITLTSMFRSYMKYAKLNELHERAPGRGAAGTPEPGQTGLQLGHYRDSGRSQPGDPGTP